MTMTQLKDDEIVSTYNSELEPCKISRTIEIKQNVIFLYDKSTKMLFLRFLFMIFNSHVYFWQQFSGLSTLDQHEKQIKSSFFKY